MRYFILALVMSLVFVSICTAQCQLDPKLVEKSDAILKELAALPTGIEVVHSPNPVKARPLEDGKYKFKWPFATSVQTKSGDVRIVEFGSFHWANERWVFSNYTGEPFTAEDFVSWYKCPGAMLVAGKSFADPENWGAANALQDQKALWYFVGVDESGNRVKGEAIVEEVAELAKGE